MTKIAVIMSVYKNDTLTNVKKALESLYIQEIDNDIYIQQDGELKESVASYLDEQKQNAKIAYIGRRAKNRGLAYSLNELLGVVLQKGYKYIARMDADDICTPYRFKKQYDFMQRNEQVDVVGGCIEEFMEDRSYKKIVCYPSTHGEMFNFFK